MVEPIPFLANIAFIANADGKLSPAELVQLEMIREELRFKKSDFNAAIRLIEQGNYKLTLVGSFADQVKNIELMLRIAFADGELSNDEASLLVEFCKTVGINQGQLDKMRGEALAVLSQREKFCPACKNVAENSMLFCPKCGADLQGDLCINSFCREIFHRHREPRQRRGDPERLDCFATLAMTTHYSLTPEKQGQRLAKRGKKNRNPAYLCKALICKRRFLKIYK